MTGAPFAVPDEGSVPNDDCGGPVGMGVLVAVPTLEYRLALPVASVAGIPQRGQVWDAPGAGTETVGMPCLAASSRSSLSVWPTAA